MSGDEYYRRMDKIIAEWLAKMKALSNLYWAELKAEELDLTKGDPTP